MRKPDAVVVTVPARGSSGAVRVEQQVGGSVKRGYEPVRFSLNTWN